MKKNHIDYLNEVFQELKQKKGFSLRDFSTFLNVSPAFLSRVFQGERIPSLELTIEISSKIYKSERKRKTFIEAVSQARLESKAKTKEKKTISEVSKHKKVIKKEKFNIISEWHHLALLELFFLDDFEPTVHWMAKRLKIDPLRVEVAIQRLIDTQIINQSDFKQKPENFLRIVKDSPSKYIRIFHEDMLKKAIAALNEQPHHVRSITGSISFADSSLIPQANIMIENFRQQLIDFLSTGTKKDSIYHLNVNLFRVDHSDV